MNEYIEFKEEYPFVEWNDQFLEDYAIFCESEDNLTDDVEEAVPGLYEDWLKQHDYDPKTNTISYGHTDRINVGKIGSSKQRNRLNQFLKRNDFDPKTGTYRSDIKLQDGSYARVPLNIGAEIPDGNMKQWKARNIPSAFFRHDENNFPSYEKATHTPDEIERRKYNNLMNLRELNDDIKHVKNKLNDPEMGDKSRRRYESQLKDLYTEKKYYTDSLKKIKRPKVSYSKRQQDYLMDNGYIAMSKSDAFSKPRHSFDTLKHEEGHADDFMHGRSINQDVEQKNLDHIAPYRTNDSKNRDALNDHDSMSDERYADIYAAKHNPHVKSSDDAYDTLTGSLNHMDKISLHNNLRNSRSALKKAENEGSLKNPDEAWSKFNDYYTKAKPRLANKNRVTHYARADMLKAHLDADPEFQKTESPYHSKTNKERSQERKERGELPRKQKKQAKKQNVVKEYMI